MAQTLDTTAIYQRGFELRCEGRYREARAELEKVLQVDPNHCEAKWQLGLIQGFEGDFEGSLQTLQEVSARYPNNLDVRYDLAMTEMMLGMNDEARANFEFILMTDPTHEKAGKAQQQLAYF